MSLNHYNKVKVIGKGSYGEVWLVKHRKDKKQYVLKKLELKTASKRERRAAEQEAKLLSRLKHPNIVSYKDSFQDETGFLFIAMGYCEGGDLYSRLKEQKTNALEERQVVEWFVQIAMALQYMHDRNILHRDLKTQNIFLTKSKIIKVGDLGIARVLDSSCDMATTLIGTPYYMSPELFSNKPYNHKSDVWALGCCVYEMATLKHAFNAKDMNSLVYKILRGKMPNMPKTYSPELVQLIRAMLSQNPEKRPSVNRILRDPYIKRNIAVFLEGTKKSRASARPSSSGGSRSGGRSARSNRGVDTPDSARSEASSSSSKSYAKARVPPPSDLEPLQVGPDLEPIKEEEDSPIQTPVKKADKPIQLTPYPRNKSPRHRTPDTRDGSRDGRRSRSHSRSPGPVSAQDLQPPSRSPPPHPDLKPKRGGSPVVSRAKLDSLDSPAGSGDLSANSQESIQSSDVSSSRKPRILKKKKKRVSESGQEPEPIVISMDSVQDASEAKSSSRSKGKSRRNSEGSMSSMEGANASKELEKSFGIVRDTSGKPLLMRKVESEPVLNGAFSERSGENKSARSYPNPSSSGSEPRPSSSGQKRASEQESGYGSALSLVKDEEGTRPTSARARRRERNNEQETPRTGRSVDLDKNRRSYEVSSSSKKQKPAYRSEDFSARSDRKHGGLDSTDGFQREERPATGKKSPDSSASDEAEEVTEVRERKRSEKEMNNFITLLDTTLRLEDLVSNREEETPELPKPSKNCFLNGATFVKGPAPPGKGMGVLPEVPVIEVEEDTLTEERVKQDKPAFKVPEYSYPTGTGHLTIPAGRTMTTTGRLWERITVLRKDCIRGLGVERLKKAYDILDNIEGDEMEPQLIALLGKEDFDFYAGKIWQLKFCEEAAFGLV